MFDKTRHYQLPDVRWNQATAGKAIQDIAGSVVAQAESGGKWPEHPMDDWGSMQSDFYLGKPGALWSVDYLQRVGAVDTRFDVLPYIPDLLADNLASYPNSAHPQNASYFFSKLPLLMMQYQREATAKKADEIAKSSKRTTINRFVN